MKKRKPTLQPYANERPSDYQKRLLRMSHQNPLLRDHEVREGLVEEYRKRRARNKSARIKRARGTKIFGEQYAQKYAEMNQLLRSLMQKRWYAAKNKQADAANFAHEYIGAVREAKARLKVEQREGIMPTYGWGYVLTPKEKRQLLDSHANLTHADIWKFDMDEMDIERPPKKGWLKKDPRLEAIKELCDRHTNGEDAPDNSVDFDEGE